MRELSGRVALVTGAGGGIGRACVSALIDAGASVIAADRDPRAGKATITHLPPASPAIFVETDVTDAESVEAMVAAALHNFGALHIAHNNAGVEAAGHPLAEMSDADWARVIDVNLTGVFHCMRAELPAIMASGGGSIVNTSSALGLVALPNQASYIASKHGVVGLTKAAALEYSAAGVRVNAICPGVVRTAMIDEVAATDDTFMDKMHAMHAIGRIAEVSEIADAVLWLASPSSSFVTGTALSVDGAYTAS
ncbi:glucose 1-dehydrogenase [Rhodococcus sp. USK13]|uniref:SDR family NAD(P)-dependent oxidoreductase n=1 Tax=Rhodococcus sp. USK13 TaxID=2806442 RepID=UPI001BCF3322|nr:glucose 1-dehydrogenase [Rhodococcus sp. USK13]